MSGGESRFARRWAARWHEPTQGQPDPPGEVLETAAMRLLSDYEDAVFASARHALIPAGTTSAEESRHLVEAVQLHADVRRLRMAIIDLMTGQDEKDEA